jgi:hypothetical protein
MFRLVFRKGLVNVVTGLVVAIVAIMIGAIIVGQLQSIIPTLNLSTDANNTITNLFTQTWGAFGLLVIVPIVLVAAVVIGILAGWGKGRGR